MSRSYRKINKYDDETSYNNRQFRSKSKNALQQQLKYPDDDVLFPMKHVHAGWISDRYRDWPPQWACGPFTLKEAERLDEIEQKKIESRFSKEDGYYVSLFWRIRRK
jgi:hypothetical protein